MCGLIKGSDGSLRSLSAKTAHHTNLAAGILLLEPVRGRLQVSIQTKHTSSLSTEGRHLLGSKHRLQAAFDAGLETQ
jgi:hypothetical protein